ncbi:hypothetical protein SSPSH_001134 [Salinisphaera shabanensis E1L3A]|jgi:uncharacterized protein YaeQ|uniref:DUF3293 domain-containing protein n=1 Tax=Salinisphaera shabanensis E1L3A TaxID=1033802 RepID=U2FVM8_9GAMM|nr:DUF3293 domain-containing protein [Salinisphaera shabanensis]ERJ19959.1 hypothetical protein SSPSH_001134 [Salinisphaera shabanensis E1L3A]
MSDDLRGAFEATDYRVFLDNESHVLHIGAPCPEPLSDWLAHRAFTQCGWLITAYNPKAEQIDAACNQARDALLRAWAQRRAAAWLETVNEAPNGGWPDEPGVLVAGIEEGEIRAMGRRLDQAALVQIAAADSIELVWLDR